MLIIEYVYNLNEDNTFEMKDQLIEIKDQIEVKVLLNDYVNLVDRIFLLENNIIKTVCIKLKMITRKYIYSDELADLLRVQVNQVVILIKEFESFEITAVMFIRSIKI